MFSYELMQKQEIGDFSCSFYRSKELNLEWIEGQHKEGFSFSYINKQTYYESYFAYYIPCGANHLSFDCKGKKIEVFDGTAHYLEHCLFETVGTEFASSLVNEFQLRGHTFNAYTTNDYTLHYIRGARDLELSLLSYARKLLQEKITNTRVELERDIIKAELAMYLDDPDIVAYNKLLDNLLVNHPQKYDILGRESSINKIRAKDLNLLLDLFYVADRVHLLMVGNFDLARVCESLSKLLLEEKTRKSSAESKITQAPLHEPSTPKLASETFNLEVEVESFYLAYKDEYYLKLFEEVSKGEKKRLVLEEYKQRITFFLNLLFSPNSSFYSRLEKRGLINDYFSYFYVVSDSLAYLVLTCQTPKARESIEYFLKILLSAYDWQQFITEDLINLQKRVEIGGLLMDFDSLDGLSHLLLDATISKLPLANYLSLRLNTSYQVSDFCLPTLAKDGLAVLHILKEAN